MALTKIESGLISNGAIIAGIETGSITSDKLANTTVTSGVYGSANQIPIITVDSDGRLTNVVNVFVSIPEGAPHPFVFTSVGS